VRHLWRCFISSIIIDGYNVIGIYHRDLRRQREMLIESLIDYRKRKGHDITVVFDGWKTGEGQEARSVIGGVQVIYSRVGEKADTVIKRNISSDNRQWIVVSSDRDIANHAWASGSIPAPAEDFLRALVRKEPSSDSSEANDDGDATPRRKGNQRQRSRREKALARALRKL
jgi:predicted RNA-binding protein with PIN domain